MKNKLIVVLLSGSFVQCANEFPEHRGALLLQQEQNFRMSFDTLIGVEKNYKGAFLEVLYKTFGRPNAPHKEHAFFKIITPHNFCNCIVLTKTKSSQEETGRVSVFVIDKKQKLIVPVTFSNCSSR